MKRYIPLILSFLVYHLSIAQNQPSQPATGPGGSAYVHDSISVYDYGTNKNGDGFWLYEPAGPKPDSANVVVFIHGLGQTNPKVYGKFIRHLVQKGNIVIYPRYQKDLLSAANTFSDSCARGIQRAIDTLNTAGHVAARWQNYFVLGHSVGGILTANMTMNHAAYNLPKPLTAMSMQPGGIEGILLPDYAAFPGDVKYLIVIGDNDAIVGTATGEFLFANTTGVPTSHKNLVKHFADAHGSPAITATHNEPVGNDNFLDNGENNVTIIFTTGVDDAVDYYCYWKLQDALMDCALRNENCDVAFGDTEAQRNMGQWSDGTAVRQLQITPSSSTGIKKADAIEVSVYPNPTNDNWQLMVNKLQAGITCFVYDVRGRCIAAKEITENKTLIESNFGSGMYFYEVKNNKGEVLTQGKLVAE